METSVTIFLVIIGTIIKPGLCQLSGSNQLLSDDLFNGDLFNGDLFDGGQFSSDLINGNLLRGLLCGRLSRLINSVFGGVDPNLKYMLFTRSNSHDSCDLQPTEEAFRKCNFNPNAKTAVIIHGYINKLLTTSPVFDIKDKLLQVDDYNVIVLDWTVYSRSFGGTYSGNDNYAISVTNSFYVGLKLSTMIHFLQVHEANINDFHLISHSLGAEVSHIASLFLCNLGRMTYLEVAAPLIQSLPPFLVPSYADAEIVESIHTNGALTEARGYGLLRPVADIDYYPNGGQTQRYCEIGAKYKGEEGGTETVTNFISKKTCSHDLVYTYYVESFNKTCKFLGRICDSYEDFTAGKCSSTPVCRMGFYSKKLKNLPPHSKCYLTTSKEPPFCRD